MKRGPDFIVIGAMKCATSTLHEQLARQPGIFMSRPKEPNFFSDEENWSKGIDWYDSLFAPAPPAVLCGESSTHYTKLPTYPQTVCRMVEHLPAHTKFIYVMRHPVDRLISHYIHEWTQRVISSSIDQAIDEHPELVAYSQYALQLQPYLDASGPQRVLPVFFEHLSRCPQTELERICEFIGYGRSPRWHDDASEQNASIERLRVSPMRDAIINMPGVKQIRRAFIPKQAREWVKGFWQMKRRPTISPDRLHKITVIFDRDLATLGNWLGLNLCCENFKQIAAETAPRWASALKERVS